jgi:secondary thiamine-phosphate synthase enzyme
MKQFSRDFTIETNDRIEFVDITDRVRDAVATSGVVEGVVTVFSKHTTCAIKINERCDRLQEDMAAHLDDAVPAAAYRHDANTIDGRPNARGHLMSLLLNASETIPVAERGLALGGWQSIFFVELDGPRHERTITVKVIGE